MIFDLLILLPVMIFLLWLYWYSTPAEQGAGARFVDRLPALLATLGALAALPIQHAELGPHVVGLARNVIAVATAYLLMLAFLGLGWGLRFRFKVVSF